MPHHQLRRPKHRRTAPPTISINHESECWPDDVVDHRWEIEIAERGRTKIIGYSTYCLEDALSQALTWMYRELKHPANARQKVQRKGKST